MPCRIRRIRPASRAEWEAHWSACGHATFFEGPDWAEIWQEYTDGRLRPAARAVDFSDGAMAVLPFSSVARYGGLVRAYLAAPAGTCAGWISREPLSPRHAELLVAYLSRHPGDLEWRISPYTPGLRADALAAEPSSTWALRLDESFDALVGRWRPALRRAVRRAQARGVTVRWAKRLDDWRAYYEVYQDSLRRWGERASSRYEWRLFERLFQRRSPGVRLWLACAGPAVVSGALCVYARRHVAYWHGATLEQSFPLRPAQLLFHDIIEDACARGHDWFDFNPSGGHASVDQFKRGFGCQELPAPVLRRESARQRALRRLTSSARAWRRRAPELPGESPAAAEAVRR